ncbi:MAG: hypothetical protein AUH13_28460 [Acidobacteria bacterium 13_2_20CM_58_27]|nr:MAG: hypothetical protein AUH13_28460 [Acidobacteria bacterium 13_2_20CM_58_27]
MLAAFEVLRPVLPQVRSSSEVYGGASLSATAGVSIAGILGDQQACLGRPGMLPARRIQKHLRHGLLPADERR